MHHGSVFDQAAGKGFIGNRSLSSKIAHGLDSQAEPDVDVTQRHPVAPSHQSDNRLLTPVVGGGGTSVSL